MLEGLFYLFSGSLDFNLELKENLTTWILHSMISYTK